MKIIPPYPCSIPLHKDEVIHFLEVLDPDAVRWQSGHRPPDFNPLKQLPGYSYYVIHIRDDLTEEVRYRLSAVGYINRPVKHDSHVSLEELEAWCIQKDAVPPESCRHFPLKTATPRVHGRPGF